LLFLRVSRYYYYYSGIIYYLDFHTRWSRRPFSSDHTIWELGDVTPLLRNAANPVVTALLRLMPWSVPFIDRLKLVRKALDQDRASIQDNNGGDIFSQVTYGGAITIHSPGSTLVILPLILIAGCAKLMSCGHSSLYILLLGLPTYSQ